MISDPDEKKPADTTKPETDATPVDEAAQEEAGKVREESGGYD